MYTWLIYLQALISRRLGGQIEDADAVGEQGPDPGRRDARRGQEEQYTYNAITTSCYYTYY